jgi:hypothetical protein
MTKKEAKPKERVNFNETHEINDDQDDRDDEKDEKEKLEKELHNKAWNAFAVNTRKDAPNLGGYLQTQETRIRHRETYELAISECIGALQELSEGILLGTSRPASAHLEKGLTSMEQEITTSLVSNHSRREICLNRMKEADQKWRRQFTLVTDSILSGVS